MKCRWPLSCGGILFAPVGELLLLQELLSAGGYNCEASGSRASVVAALCAADVRVLVILLDLIRQQSASSPGTLAEIERWLEQQPESAHQSIAENFASRGQILLGETKSVSRRQLQKRRLIWGRNRSDFFPDLSRKQAKRLIKGLVNRSLWKELGRVEFEVPLDFSGTWRRSSTSDHPNVAEADPICERPDTNDSSDERSNAQAFQDQKLLSLRGLAYGASHEINNPLANIAMRAETLARSESDDSRRMKLWVIQQQALRAHQMISDLMLFANPPRSEPQEVDLPQLLREVVAEHRPQLSGSKIEVHVAAASLPTSILADRRQISEMVKALLLNSIQAIGSDGEIRISVQVSPQGVIAIEVSDTGVGIPLEIQGKIFDPFFSGREAGRGLGFGLSKAWRIANEHGGDLKCLSGEAGATRFLATICDLKECQAKVA